MKRYLRRPIPQILICLVLHFASPLHAGLWDALFPHDVDVMTVTDMTEVGRTYPNATPKEPVYYMIIDLGERYFGRSWAGERKPKSREALKWTMEAMAKQGYRLADDQHPPTQLFVFGWGMIQGGSGRPALKFLGGDKADLMWEQEENGGFASKNGGFVNSRVLLRGIQRTGIAGKLWDISESDLFIGIVRSYTMDSLKSEKTVLLWETRFGCPATGLWMTEAMPQMIKVAALNFGRETKLPVSVDASDYFKGRVDHGELKIMGTVPEPATDRTDQNPLPAKTNSP